jgi:hypothetical protein
MNKMEFASSKWSKGDGNAEIMRAVSVTRPLVSRCKTSRTQKTESKHKSPGYWQDINNVRLELRKRKDRKGRIPCSSDTSVNIIAVALCTHHKTTYVKFAEAEGLTIKRSRKPNKYWKDLGTVEKEVLRLKDAKGRMPFASNPAVGVIPVILCTYHNTTYVEFLEARGLKTSKDWAGPAKSKGKKAGSS